MKSKHLFIKIVSTLIVMLTVIGTMTAPVAAATDLNATKKETLPNPSSITIKTYTERTSGRVNAQGTSGWVDCAVDECTITSIASDGTSITVKYPIGNGRYTTRKFSTQEFLGISNLRASFPVVTATAKIITYRRSNGGSQYGYISNGDKFFVLKSGSLYKTVIYPLSAGGYKLGYIKNNDFNTKTKVIADMIDVTKQFAGKTVRLKSVQNGKYLCADQDKSNTPALCNKNSASSWETFTVQVTSDGWAGFKASNGKFLSARKEVTNTPIRATANNVKAYECFRIYQKDGNYYLKSQANNLWVCVRVDINNAPAQAYASAPNSWERFKIEVVNTKASNTTSFDPVWPCATAYKVSTMYFYWNGGTVTKHRTLSNSTNSDGFLNAIDITGGGDIVATEAGEVIAAGWRNGGFGNTVIIKHDNGLYSLYGHLKSIDTKVKVGERVSRNQTIAKMGNTGNSDGEHLHFEMYALSVENGKEKATIVDPFLTYFATKYSNKILIGDVSPKANQKVLNGYIKVSNTAKSHISQYLDVLSRYYNGRYW